MSTPKLKKILDQKADEELFEELEQRAIGFYLDKTDFDATEWLSDEDLPVYLKLFKKLNGYCLTHGEDECEC